MSAPSGLRSLHHCSSLLPSVGPWTSMRSQLHWSNFPLFSRKHGSASLRFRLFPRAYPCSRCPSCEPFSITFFIFYAGSDPENWLSFPLDPIWMSFPLQPLPPGLFTLQEVLLVHTVEFSLTPPFGCWPIVCDLSLKRELHEDISRIALLPCFPP